MSHAPIFPSPVLSLSRIDCKLAILNHRGGFVARFVPEWSLQPYQELLSAVHAIFGSESPAASEKAFWYRAMLPPGSPEVPELDWHVLWYIIIEFILAGLL